MDGDGFDDGTGASRVFMFATLGEKTVRVRARDVDGGTSAAARMTVSILNRPLTGVTIAGAAQTFLGEAIALTAEPEIPTAPPR